MLKSMTAYGRAQKGTKLGRFSVEIQSVNRKYLEINLSLPKELWRFDTICRKWIGERMYRGLVNVKVNAAYELGAPISVRPNLPMARRAKQALEEITLELHIQQAVGLDNLSSIPDLLIYEEDFQDDDVYLEVLRDLFSEALDAAEQMKVAEGNVLQKEIQQRLELIRAQCGKIAAAAADTTAKYREKLKAKLAEVLGSAVEDERLLKEICLFAEKSDITEELTRIESHLVQCEALLNSKEAGMGKTIDFLTQELNREANTIGSKVLDKQASFTVVEMKGEIEKIRQQVQNIE
jgi:uncharacterized protein (TIGR00255 family)